MDEKKDAERLAQDFKLTCDHYRKDYKIIPNKHGQIASLVIDEIDKLIGTYGNNAHFMKSVLCSFMAALIGLLEEIGSDRLLPAIRQLAQYHNLHGQMTGVKKEYRDEIACFIACLRKNNTFFATPIPFNMDIFVKKYVRLNPQEEGEKVYPINNYKRLTSDITEFLESLMEENTGQNMPS